MHPDKLNRCIAVIARAAGPAGMVGGQAFDLASDGDMAIGRESMELLHRSKTGVIFKAAIDMAAIVADAYSSSGRPWKPMRRTWA